MDIEEIPNIKVITQKVREYFEMLEEIDRLKEASQLFTKLDYRITFTMIDEAIVSAEADAAARRLWLTDHGYVEIVLHEVMRRNTENYG